MRLTFSMLITLACILLVSQISMAADRDMELPGNWTSSRVDWRRSLGIPIDTEFVAPLTAHYNWAYGNTLLGVNVRQFGAREFYAAIASFSDDRLDILDSEGPLPGAAILRSGRYHVTAGLADGRILCWLTAPGEYPVRLQLANRYLRGSGFDVIVEAPDPPSATWADWTILVCFQTSLGENNIATEVYDGNGRLIYDLPGLQVAGRVRQLEYTRSPVPGVDLPWLLMSIDSGSVSAGAPYNATVGTAWYVPGEQWYLQGVRPGGRDNSSIYLDDEAAGGAIALMAWDDSDEFSSGGFIERLHMRSGNARQIITDKGLPNLFNWHTTSANWCFGRTVSSRYPYVLFSDGTDLMFGYNAARRGEEGADVGYRTFTLMQGLRVSDDYGNEGPLYSLEGLALSTHWNTGQPQVFYIQNGSADYEGGQLYQMRYERPGRSGD